MTKRLGWRLKNKMDIPKKTNKENRKYVRFPQYIDVDYTIVENNQGKPLAAGTYYEGFVENISEGGVLLAVDKRIELGKQLELTIKIGKPIQSVTLYGRVVRIEEISDGIYELGILFTKYFAIDKELLEQFLGEVIK
jgi:hypothetical protein